MSRKRRLRKQPAGQPRGNSDEWPEVTKPKGYRYYFHPKHHGTCRATVSCWRLDVLRPEEFTIFEIAVCLDLADEHGNLYNVRKSPDGMILKLGKFDEQIARFWKPSTPTEAWHGHPHWPVETGPSNLAKEKNRPSTAVFRKLVEQRVLTEAQSRRLNNGKHV